MKKIFTLLATALATFSMAAQDVTMTWNLSSATDLNAVVTGEGADAIVTSDITLGSNLTLNGKRDTNGVSGMNVKKGSAYPKTAPSTSENYVQFPFTVADGKKFVVSEITFYVGKVGSNENLSGNVFMMNNANEKLTIQTGVDFKRNNADNNYFTIGEYLDFSTWEALVSDNALTFNLYSSSGKYKNDAWFSTIVIKGTIQDSGFVDTREDVELAWDPASITLKLRDPFTAPTLTKSADVEIEFASTNEKVATVDENGVVSLVEGATGSATITANFNGNDNYKPANAVCAITVNTNVTDKNFQKDYTSYGLPCDRLLNTNTESAAGNVLLDDDFVKITTPFKSNKASYSMNAFGYEFRNNIQVRTKNAPTDAALEGTENSGSSSLVIEAKQDTRLVLFIRRQTLEDKSLAYTVDDVEKNEITNYHAMGFSENDGKSVFLSDHNNISAKLPQEIRFGEWLSGADYIGVATIFTLEEGHTYTAWATGTTIALYAIGFDPAMTAPWHADATEENGYQPSYNAGDVVRFLHADPEATIIYTLDGADPDENNIYVEVAPEAAPARAAAETVADVDHTGKTYNVATHPIIYNGEALNIAYKAVKDGYKPSEIQTLSIGDNGETTGIENVAVETENNAPVEFFNLQGIRVENPSNGIFIRRQGKTISKVIVK